MRIPPAFLLLPVATAFLLTTAGKRPSASEGSVPSRPALVVALVVDQMRFDYLYRYWDKYEAGGFRRLVGQGFNCRNVNFNYMPTYTGPGHASIFTGTVPAIHGIIGNNWFDRESGREVYCVEDKTVTPVGTEDKEGRRSPRKCITTTVGDQLQLSNLGASKVIGISRSLLKRHSSRRAHG
jgi:predicted AlkP superfamily pyrophosphatase or phosphodiesterase